MVVEVQSRKQATAGGFMFCGYLDHKYKIEVLPDPENEDCLAPWLRGTSFSLLVLIRFSQSSLPKLGRSPAIDDGL